MNYLIDLDTLKNLSLTHENVENDVIRKTLRRSQDMYIEPILGTAFYDRLLDGVENSNLTANETTLIEDYIQITLCTAFELRIADTITTEIRNIGTGVATEQNFQANSPSDMERTKDMIQKELTFYTNRLKRYLCENESLFPQYTASNEYGLKPERQQKNSYSKNFVMFKKR